MSNATVVVCLPTASASALATSVVIGGMSDSPAIAVVLPAPIGPANTMRYGPIVRYAFSLARPNLRRNWPISPDKRDGFALVTACLRVGGAVVLLVGSVIVASSASAPSVNVAF